MDCKLVFAGVGGQGIVFLTRLIGGILVDKGHHVISTENHGMATRGGSVLAFMKIGNYHSPLILHHNADVGVVLHPDELEKVKLYCKENAKILGYSVNEGQDVKPVIERHKLHPRVANIYIAGLILKDLGITESEIANFLKRLGKDTEENLFALKLSYSEETHAHVPTSP